MSEPPARTDDQMETINNRFWLGQEVPCPRCGANVQVRESGELGFPTYVLARCLGCGAQATFQAAPRRDGEFSKEQMEEIVGLYQRSRASVCPRDGTRLEVEAVQLLVGGCLYSVTCPRCGVSGELQWMPTEVP